MVYIDDQYELMDFTAALESVGLERRQYALRYRQESDQLQCLAAYLLLQRALREEYGMTTVPPFAYGPNGKPFFEDYPDIQFNLSHCREAVACVVARVPVGIDIESVGIYDDELVRRTMNEQEQQLIAKSDNPQAAFTRLWTMKESVLKLTGEGMVDDLHSVLSDAHHYSFHVIPHSRYICTICRGACQE